VEHKTPIQIDRTKDHVMDSAYNYLRTINIKRRYSPLKLLVDSGAYTAARKKIELDPYKIIEIQERLGSDIAVPLDYPFMPYMTFEEMKKRWIKTIENTKLWVEVLNPRIDVMPMIHALNKKNLEETIKIISRIAENSDIVGLGTIVDPTFTLKGFLSDRQPRKELFEMLLYAIMKVKEFGYKVHVTGFGSSPLTLHIGLYMGVDSTDSSGYRRKAAYGKIVLPFTGERYIGNGKATFGVSMLSKKELKFIKEKCQCPVCSSNPHLLWKDWRARAIHNEWVIKQELKKGLKLLNEGLDIYEKYLDKLFLRSSLWHLWKYIKTQLKYKKLHEYSPNVITMIS